MSILGARVVVEEVAIVQGTLLHRAICAFYLTVQTVILTYDYVTVSSTTKCMRSIKTKVRT